jgi:hypothetical protein
MRKLLGADWKSADGIVGDRSGFRRPEGDEQVRIAVSSLREHLRMQNAVWRSQRARRWLRSNGLGLDGNVEI